MARRRSRVNRRRGGGGKSCLLFGEGSAEQKFLNHLAGFYSGAGITYKSKGGAGGSPDDVISKAVKAIEDGDYHYKLAVIDNDHGSLSDKSRESIKAHGIHLIAFSPCLEAVLLELTGQAVADRYKCGPNKSAIKKLLDDNPVQKASNSSLNRLFSKSIIENYVASSGTDQNHGFLLYTLQQQFSE